MASCLLNIYIWLLKGIPKPMYLKWKNSRNYHLLGNSSQKHVSDLLVHPSFSSPPLIKPCHFYVLCLRSALSPFIPFPPPHTQSPHCHCVRWSAQGGSAGWPPPFSKPRFHPSDWVRCPSSSTSSCCCGRIGLCHYVFVYRLTELELLEWAASLSYFCSVCLA